MGITFNVDELFEMAEQIERNGARFYRQAAENAPDAQTKQMLLELARMEDGHLETFRQMRKGLIGREKAQSIFDPDNEAVLYLQTMADSRGSEGMRSPGVPLTGQESIEEVLQLAIEAEKNSVLFYVGLKDLVPARAGQEKVNDIIKEEINHVAILRRKLSALGGG